MIRKGGSSMKMKRIIIVLLICSLFFATAIIGHGRIYSKSINTLYDLKYGIRVIPIIKQLCLIKAKNCMFLEDYKAKSVDILLVYTSFKKTDLGNQVNYVDTFMLTGYTILN